MTTSAFRSVNFITNLPAPYKVACFKVIGRAWPSFKVTFEHTNAPWHPWQQSLEGAEFRYVVLPRHWRRGIEWIRIALDRGELPIYGYYGHLGPAASLLLRRLTGGRYAMWSASRLSDWRKPRRLARAVKRLAFSGAEVVLVPGTEAEEYARAMGARAVARTPNAIDVAALDRLLAEAARTEGQRSGPEKLRAVFVGRLAPEKHVDAILRALAMATKDGQVAISLRVVGDGPERESLERQAQQLGLAQIVEFVGYATGVELARQYVWADVLLLPSLSEPWGLVVNEAMQAGTVPVVSDRVGCARDLIEDGVNGFVFPAGDANSLAEILSRLGRRESSLSEYKRRARAKIAAYTPEAFGRGLVQALERIAT